MLVVPTQPQAARQAGRGLGGKIETPAVGKAFRQIGDHADDGKILAFQAIRQTLLQTPRGETQRPGHPQNQRRRHDPAPASQQRKGQPSDTIHGQPGKAAHCCGNDTPATKASAGQIRLCMRTPFQGALSFEGNPFSLEWPRP